MGEVTPEKACSQAKKATNFPLSGPSKLPVEVVSTPAVARPRGARPTALVAGFVIVPALALVLAGAGLWLAALVGGAGQLAIAAGYGRDVWPGLSRARAILLAAPAVALFWALALVVVPRAQDELGAQLIAAALAGGLLLYVVAGAIALRRSERTAAWAWPVAVAAGFAPLAAAVLVHQEPTPPPPSHGQELRQVAAAHVRGAQGVTAGASLAGGVDVDGDGRPDVLVGSPNPGGAGYVTLLFGGPGGARSVLRGTPDDAAGTAVALLADQDGDHRGELVLGAPSGLNRRREVSGVVYVVRGAARTAATVRLAALGRAGGPAGYRIDGAYGGDSTGYSVADAGDVNGDGIDDLAIGVPRFNDQREPTGFGAVYVVWGSRRPRAVDLAPIAVGRSKDGYIAYSRGSGTAGVTVADAGDVNGDGRPDLAIGVPDAVYRERGESGLVYVVYGQTRARTIDLASVGQGARPQGFVIGGAAGEQAGTAVAGADVNGDGLGDVVIGAPRASAHERPRSGSVYVIYGRRGATRRDIDLARLAHDGGGYRIDGAKGARCIGVPCGDQAGGAVASAGDVNGDGLGDLVIGAPAAGEHGRPWSGSAFVVYGQKGEASVDLAAVGRAGNVQGYRLDGARSSDRAGTTVAAAGDLDGDGVLDLVIGAPEAHLRGGEVYAVPGPKRDRSGT